MDSRNADGSQILGDSYFTLGDSSSMWTLR